MSDFLEIANRLDIHPGSRDTTNDKALAKSRAISKINYQFEIPHTVINLAALGVAQGGALVHQFNITSLRNFRILNIINNSDVTDFNKYAYICVRYRIDDTVYRYRLSVQGYGLMEEFFNTYFTVHADRYVNQEIKANFVIELWTLSDAQATIDIGPFTVVTGMLRNPTNVDETSEEIDIAQELDAAALFQTINPFEFLPTVYGNDGKWLTN